MKSEGSVFCDMWSDYVVLWCLECVVFTCLLVLICQSVVKSRQI